MVGFVCEPAKEEEGGVANQLKVKTSDDSERHRVGFEGYTTDFDCFSLASLEAFVEFDSIKDWIEEMEVPDSVQCSKPESGSGLGEGRHLQNSICAVLVQDMDNKEPSGPVKLECRGTDDHVVEDREGVVGIMDSDGKESITVVDGAVGVLKSDGINNSSVVDLLKADLGNTECHYGEKKSMDSDVGQCGVDMLDTRSFGKTESLSCSIEEGLEKVTLVGEERCLVDDESDVKELGSRIIKDGSESKSELETEDSSSSSSTSSDSSENDDEKESLKKNCENIEHKVDVEEGEIRDIDADKMVSWTDNDDDDDDEDDEDDDNADEGPEDSEIGEDIGDDEDCLPKGPIRSKNEQKDLPPVPPVNVNLQPNQQILPVGVVLSVLGTQVIVEGSEKHNPLSEGSIVWIAERRLPLGIVDEIFGPVKTPYYIVRYNSESDVPAGIENGITVGFVPEFVGHVLNDKSLYQKGYDASGENDEEVYDEVEFSDDEKEAEYKRMLKASKRGNNSEGQGPANKRKSRKNTKNREKTWTRNQPSAAQSPTIQPSQPSKMQQAWRPPTPSFNQGMQPSGQSNLSGSSAQMPGPGLSGGPTVFPQMPQPAPLMLNGNWTNGMPSQQQNMAVSGGFQMNGMPWLQQNHLQPLQMPSTAPPWPQHQHFPQFPLGNPGPSQQPFDLSQLVTRNNGSPFVPMNFTAGATNSQWPGMVGSNMSIQAPFYAGFQNPNAQLPMLSGFMPNGPQPAGPVGLNSNPVQGLSFPSNEEASQFHQGFSSGRGRGRKPFQGRGGRFGGGRGRHQSK